MRTLLAALLIGLAATSVVCAADDEEEDEDLGLPGLAFVLEGLQHSAASLDVVPRLAFSLDADESAAPRQSPEVVGARWSGRVQVLRPGNYVFRAEVSGRVTLTVGGRVVLDGEGRDGGASIVGAPVELKYGQTPLEATFAKVEPTAAARLRMFWRREGEGEAPVSAVALNRPAPKSPTIPSDATALRAAAERVVELRCTACHRTADAPANAPPTTFEGLPIDRPPDLSGIGDRVRESWLHRWLDEPHAWRKNTAMPDLFGDRPDDRVDLHATVKFLASLRSAKPGDANQPSADASHAANAAQDLDVAATRKAMAAVGCIACHRLPEEEVGRFAQLRPLDNLGDKFFPEALRRRIVEPRAHFADSRMPDFRLAAEQPQLLQDVVTYLTSKRSESAATMPPAPTAVELERRWNALFDAAPDRERFEQLPEHERWIALGRRVFESRGCVNCHPLDGLKPRLVASPWPTRGVRTDTKTDSANSFAGCLADQPSPTAADYRWSLKSDASLVRRGLELPAKLPNERLHPAPLFTAADQLRRNGCWNCHDSGREAGAFSQRILQFAPLASDQVLHDVAPPNLAGIGEKLLDRTLADVIDGKTRARPWMALRMPTFKPEHVAGLAKSLRAIDGLAADDRRAPKSVRSASSDDPNLDDLIETGRSLTGRTGLNCVSCHDIRGIKSIGVRGPDLANVPRRVRREWFDQWLLDPQRMAPGTRMPTVFFGGKSAAPQFYDGDPQRQLDALWAYLSQGNQMKLPSLAPPANAVVPGGENPRFAPTDRPLVVRGFMPGTAGLRGLAIGTPQKLHFAFDTERCALAAAWRGEFAEVGGWYDNGRGSAEENAVKPLGKIVWRGVEEPQWYVAPAVEDLRTDFGRPLAPRFEAAWAHEGARSPLAGVRYSFEVRPGENVSVEERWLPNATTEPVGFTRRFRVEGTIAKPGLRLLVCEHVFDFRDAQAEYESAGVRWRVKSQNGAVGAGFRHDTTKRHFVTIDQLTAGRPREFFFVYRLVPPTK